jgi:hypothetical protein
VSPIASHHDRHTDRNQQPRNPAAEGIRPAPDKAATTCAQFLRSQAEALPTADFLETITLTGARMYALAVIELASRRIRIPGATAHPAPRGTQAARDLVIDLQNPGDSYDVPDP